MSYYSEHQKMKPVLDKACELAIATNPAPEALFEAGNAGFQIWCSPEDHPVGWEHMPMSAGAFSKPCEYVASVQWGWEGGAERGESNSTTPAITHLLLSTDAYAWSEFNDRPRYTGHNRPEDLAWAQEKIRWLFSQANVPLLPIRAKA